MPTRQNRYFNNPQMAAAFSNLAGIFAPPAAQDFLAMAKTDGVEAQNARLAQLFDAAGGDFDRMGMAAGQWNPNQSFYAVDQGNAVTMRGQDIGAQTALATNTANNQTRLRSDLLGIAGNPQGSQSLDADLISAITGIDGVALPGAQPVAPTDAQVLGANRQEMIDQIPGLREALAADGVSASNVVTEDGTRMMPTGLAAVQGAEPFINRGAEAARRPITLVGPNGEQIPGFFDPSTGGYFMGDGSPAPEGFRAASLPQPTGSNVDLGLTTTGQNRADAQFQNATRSLEVLNELDTLLAQNPGATGIAGGLQRITQNLVQTVDEVGQLLGGGFTPADLVENEFIDRNTFDVYFNSAFNPNLSEIDILFNQLVWAYAAGQQNDGRVSNQQMEQARRSLGIDGTLSNTAQVRAALGRLRGQFERDRASAAELANPNVVRAFGPEVRGGPQRPAAAPAQGAQPAAAPAFQPGALPKPDDVDPGVWNFLTEDEQRMWLNGRSR